MSCSDVLKWGIFNRETINSTDEFFNSIRKWFSLNKFHTKTDTYQAAASAGITIPSEVGLIPMNFDGTYGENHHNNYSEALSEILFDETYYKREFYRDNVEASSVIVNAWKDCQLFERAPLFAQALYQDNAQGEEFEEILVKVKINYIDPDNPDIVYINQDAIREELQSRLPGYELIPFIETRLSPSQPFPFLIKRNKTQRERGGWFIVRTTHQRYFCEIKLAPIPEFSPIEFRKDEGDLRHLISQGQKEAGFTLQNLKNKNILIDIKAEFHIWGPNSGTCDLRLYCDGKIENREKVSITNNGIWESIIFSNIAWSPGTTRKIVARIENWSFSSEPQRWFVHLTCEY